MSVPDPLTEALAPAAADRGMGAECADIGREFQGWDITWTSSLGFTARKGDDVIGPCTSRTALRCQLALAEHRVAW